MKSVRVIGGLGDFVSSCVRSKSGSSKIRSQRKFSNWLASAFLVALALLSLYAFRLAPAVSAAVSSTVPGFGREVIVDHQRVTGEPSISIDSQDRIYVSAPYGFSTTASFVWRSMATKQ